MAWSNMQKCVCANNAKLFVHRAFRKQVHGMLASSWDALPSVHSKSKVCRRGCMLHWYATCGALLLRGWPHFRTLRRSQSVTRRCAVSPTTCALAHVHSTDFTLIKSAKGKAEV
jgi:hypothetical protein